MNSYYPATNWNPEKPKELYFTSWFLVDQLGASALLIALAVALGVVVWFSSGLIVAGTASMGLMLLTIWRIFLPVHYELNSEGILRWTIGRKRLISWDDVRIYEIRPNGILLLPQRDRFFLEAFRGFFLPVPGSLMPEVLYRFRMFVDKIHD